jgi:hypothetical protein
VNAAILERLERRRRAKAVGQPVGRAVVDSVGENRDLVPLRQLPRKQAQEGLHTSDRGPVTACHEE